MSTKVFVGNLAFRTTDQDLQEAFADCGNVVNGIIITRGRRSLGYGFVTFASAEEAAAAVAKKSQLQIFDRQVKVELAKDIADLADEEMQGNSPNQRRNQNQQRNRNQNQQRNQDQDQQNNDPQGNRRQGARRGRGGRRGGRASNPTDERQTNAGVNDASGDEQTPLPAQRRRNPPRDTGPKVPSKTTLFVANLPFTFRDEDLTALFEGTKLKSAHIVRSFNGRSRGYGFVEFENEADQLAAVELKHNASVDSAKGAPRKITVTISSSVGSTLPNGDEAPSGAADQKQQGQQGQLGKQEVLVVPVTQTQAQQVQAAEVHQEQVQAQAAQGQQKA